MTALDIVYLNVNYALRPDRDTDRHIGFEINTGAEPALWQHLRAGINIALLSPGKALTDDPGVGAALTTQIKLVF